MTSKIRNIIVIGSAAATLGLAGGTLAAPAVAASGVPAKPATTHYWAAPASSSTGTGTVKKPGTHYWA